MDQIRNYPRCIVLGDGELNIKPDKRGYPFHVQDISGTGVRVRTEKNIEIKQIVFIRMKFSGHIIEVPIETSGEVVKKAMIGNEYEYAIKFTDLSQKEKVEIDEIIRRSCYNGRI